MAMGALRTLSMMRKGPSVFDDASGKLCRPFVRATVMQGLFHGLEVLGKMACAPPTARFLHASQRQASPATLAQRAPATMMFLFQAARCRLRTRCDCAVTAATPTATAGACDCNSNCDCGYDCELARGSSARPSRSDPTATPVTPRGPNSSRLNLALMAAGALRTLSTMRDGPSAFSLPIRPDWRSGKVKPRACDGRCGSNRSRS